MDMKTGSRYNQLVEYLKGLNYDKYIWKLNELVKEPKIKFLLDESFGGYLSDDKLKFSVIDIPVRKLVPCQNEIDVTKSLKYGLTKPESLAGYFKNPVVIKTPIITYNGNFIIDGHHRWSQVYCFNINAKMTAWNYEGDFSAMQMLKIMQAAIASDLGEVPTHKVEGMNLLTADIEDIKNYIREVADPKFYDEYAKCAKCNDDPEEIINIIASNCESMQSDNNCIKDAPNRGFMPQTDEAPSVLEDIKEGVVVMSDHKRKNFSDKPYSGYNPKIQECIMSVKDDSLRREVSFKLGNLCAILSGDDVYHKLDSGLRSEYDSLFNEFLKCKTDNEFQEWIDNYNESITKIMSNKTRTKSAPKVITSESNYYVDIDGDRIYVKIGEHDADHEDAPYEEYTYYFDKKEWDPSVPELPERIKKLIGNYIKDTDVFSDKSDDDKYREAIERYKNYDYSKRTRRSFSSTKWVVLVYEDGTKDLKEYKEGDQVVLGNVKSFHVFDDEKMAEKFLNSKTKGFSKDQIINDLKELAKVDMTKFDDEKVYDQFAKEMRQSYGDKVVDLIESIIFEEATLYDSEINKRIQNCECDEKSIESCFFDYRDFLDSYGMFGRKMSCHNCSTKSYSDNLYYVVGTYTESVKGTESYGGNAGQNWIFLFDDYAESPNDAAKHIKSEFERDHAKCSLVKGFKGKDAAIKYFDELKQRFPDYKIDAI